MATSVAALLRTWRERWSTPRRRSRCARAIGDPDAARQAWQAALVILDGLGDPDADRVRTKL